MSIDVVTMEEMKNCFMGGIVKFV
ncbi:Protein of unknown function [Bacillus cereus]|nr:Protein of unknown function [Bacillus cereus]